MRTAIVLGFCVAAAALSSPAAAEVFAGVGFERLRWTEDTVPAVTETGPLLAVVVGYTQDKSSGAVFAYRGRLYLGDVDYSGATLVGGTPIEGVTSYFGYANEAQGRWRRPIRDNYRLDMVLGIGWDRWRRELSDIQKEDYDIVYLRLGAEVEIRSGQGWTLGAGAKYPIRTRENAHFTDLGFDQNPVLRPGRDVGGYAHIGYRFDGPWSAVLYYEGYRFKDSRPEEVTSATLGAGAVYQPASSMSILGIRAEYRFR